MGGGGSHWRRNARRGGRAAALRPAPSTRRGRGDCGRVRGWDPGRGGGRPPPAGAGPLGPPAPAPGRAFSRAASAGARLNHAAGGRGARRGTGGRSAGGRRAARSGRARLAPPHPSHLDFLRLQGDDEKGALVRQGGRRHGGGGSARRRALPPLSIVTPLAAQKKGVRRLGFEPRLLAEVHGYSVPPPRRRDKSRRARGRRHERDSGPSLSRRHPRRPGSSLSAPS